MPNEHPCLETQELPVYVHLRQALDSLVYMAIHYYAAGKRVEEREERAEQIEGLVREVLGELRDPGGCPPGYYECDGYCVPVGYPCLLSAIDE